MKRGFIKGIVLFVVLMSFYPIIKTGYDMRGENIRSKIWLHSTNTIDKFKHFEGEYENFELDVIYRNDNRFEVTHDLSDNTGVYLEQYFEEIKDKNTNLWIDLKNINSDNNILICTNLSKMCDQYNINKNRLIIETRDWRSLSLFTKNNFYTSWYLDIKSKDMSEDDCVKLKSEIKEITDNNSVNAISFFGENYSFIDDLNIDNIDLLTWEHRKQKELLPFFRRTRSMLHDDKIKVILVKDRGDE